MYKESLLGACAITGIEKSEKSSMTVMDRMTIILKSKMDYGG